MEDKAMTKREMVQAMSDATGLKTEVVHSVLDSFIDLFILETVAKGKFRLDKCFTVDTTVRTARKQYNVFEDEYKEYPEMNVLNIKLSRNINYMHRWKERNINNNKANVTIEEFKNLNEDKKD